MIKKLTGNINSFLVALEIKVGLLSASLFLGVILLLLAMIYVQPNFEVLEAEHHGIYFSEFSKHPFRFAENNPLQYRILGPLIGYITFLRGDLFFIVPLLFDVFLLAAIYHHYRKSNYEVTDAFIMTAFIGFSGTILIPLVLPGFIDCITYFFLFLAFAKTARVKSSALFFGLALLNYESSLLLLPALFLYTWYIHKAEKLIVLRLFFIFLAACLPYIGYRCYVSSHADILYSFHYYFRYLNIYHDILDTFTSLPMGVFYSFRLLWFFPIYALFKLWQQKERQLAWVILLIIAFNAAQLFIVLDTTRVVCIAFPAILLSAEYLKKIWSTDYFRSFSIKLLLFNFLVIPYFVWDGIFNTMPSVLYNLAYWASLHLVDFVNAKFL
jgi:hypothetical protein